MRSFAAIATFATLAFSAVTSALPTGAPVDTASLLDVNVLVKDITVTLSNVLNPEIEILNVEGNQNTGKREVAIPSVNLPRGDEPTGIPDVLVEVTAKIAPIVKDLTAKITAEVDVQVALKLALDVLAQVKVILEGAVAQIKVIVEGDLSAVLCLKGTVIDIKIVAKLLADLIAVITLALALVVKVCASVDIKVLLGLVVDISGLLAVIVGLVLKVAGGLLVHLVPLLKVVINIIVSLKLTALIDILHIGSGY